MARRTRIVLPALALLLLFGAPGAKADTITYTFQGTGSGSIGDDSFSHMQFTITVTADTNDISEFTLTCGSSPCTILDVPATTATITVDGLTSAITSSIGVFDNQTVGVLGLSRITGPGPGGISMDLLDLTDPTFTTYNLMTSLGPVGPLGVGNLPEFNCSAGCVVTDLGDLTLTSASKVTFTDPVSTPEPSAILLLGCGALALVALRRKFLANSRS